MIRDLPSIVSTRRFCTGNDWTLILLTSFLSSFVSGSVTSLWFSHAGWSKTRLDFLQIFKDELSILSSRLSCVLTYVCSADNQIFQYDYVSLWLSLHLTCRRFSRVPHISLLMQNTRKSLSIVAKLQTLLLRFVVRFPAGLWLLCLRQYPCRVRCSQSRRLRPWI